MKFNSSDITSFHKMLLTVSIVNFDKLFYVVIYGFYNFQTDLE